jgi:hypothetical protein
MPGMAAFKIDDKDDDFFAPFNDAAMVERTW